MTGGRARLAPRLLAVVALLFAACEGDESLDAPAAPTAEPTPTASIAGGTPDRAATATPTTTPTATATPTPEPIILGEDGLPEGVEGPLFVSAMGPHDGDRYRVFLYDAGRSQQIGSFEVDRAAAGGLRPLHLAGRELLVADSQQVAAHRLDGRRTRVVVEAAEGERLSSIVLSPDGRLLALARHERNRIAPHTVEIIDVASGRTVTELDIDSVAIDGNGGVGSRWPRGDHGWPIPSQWSSDASRLFMRGLVESTAPGTLRVLTLDGEVHSYGLAAFGLVDPTGSFFAFGEGASLAYGGGPHDNLRVLDLHDETEFTITEHDELAFLPVEWAPDGSALVYEVMEPADGRSIHDHWTRRELRLYDIASGEDVVSPPLDELRAEWQPGSDPGVMDELHGSLLGWIVKQ